MMRQPALGRQLGDVNGDENSQLSFLHWTAMNSIVMMNVARFDVFCQVGFLGSNIGHSGHFALVRKIGPATAGGEEERKARCSKSRWASFHHDDLGFNYGHLEAISSVFLQKPKQLFILLSLLPFLWHQSFFFCCWRSTLTILNTLGLFACWVVW